MSSFFFPLSPENRKEQEERAGKGKGDGAGKGAAQHAAAALSEGLMSGRRTHVPSARRTERRTRTWRFLVGQRRGFGGPPDSAPTSRTRAQAAQLSGTLASGGEREGACARDARGERQGAVAALPLSAWPSKEQGGCLALRHDARSAGDSWLGPALNVQARNGNR